MEAVHIEDNVIETEEVVTAPTPTGSFIEANTVPVTLEHLKKDCIIPVFSKDNETTISHYEFIDSMSRSAKLFYKKQEVHQPEIRVSHMIKGRVPTAIGKPAKNLKENEKTLYYERCAFLIEINSGIEVNGCELKLSVGGVRAYNQENLYSKKTIEKFKIFIGFKNKVCTNLCISTDGFLSEVRVASIEELKEQMVNLFRGFDSERQITTMQKMSQFFLNEQQFAHLLGKLRMHQYLSQQEQKRIGTFLMNDSQLNQVARNFYLDPNFSSSADRSISLWNLYNLFTGANKSSYIDMKLERNVNAYVFVNNLAHSLETGRPSWFLQ